MTSRLDRLFLLLETGSSPLTRKAAALQLGEVQKLHPHELHNLLTRVHSYLHSSSWDTRTAAGQAVEAIISSVPQWDPPGMIVKEEVQSNETSSASQAGRMKFAEFDINKVIQNGRDLLASESHKYEVNEIQGLNIEEKLAKQRQMLNKHLGLEIAGQLGFDPKLLVSDEDLNDSSATCSLTRRNNKHTLSEVFSTEMNNLTCRYNSHKITKLKLKQPRALSTQSSKDKCQESPDSEPPAKKLKTSLVTSDTSCGDNSSVEKQCGSENLWEESKEWPFTSFCDELTQDLFNASWEIRHGAAVALREVVKIHGKGAGKTTSTLSSQMELVNQLWLEDLALRFTCVLALDKFGDFISDQVVAPVRETCAQALGAVVNLMLSSSVEGVLRILLQLLSRPEWEARHGGLLGLKYILAVRKDLKSLMIPLVFEPVCESLKDNIDDVSAVAASALVPVTDIIVKILPYKVSSILTSLWDALLDLDDLTASTSSILQLLSSLLSYTDLMNSVPLNSSFDDLVQRLWPFLDHSSADVRKSVLQALVTLTSNKSAQPCEIWLPKILPVALRLIYQHCLTEHQPEIHDLLFTVWKNMVTSVPLVAIASATFPFLSSWLSMIMQPSRVPFDPSVNSSWLSMQHKSKDKVHSRNRKSFCLDNQDKITQEQYYIGGNDIINESPSEKEKYIARAKLTAAKCLGLLCSYIAKPVPGVEYTSETENPADSFAKLVVYHLNSKSALQRLAVSLVLSQWAKYDKAAVCPLSIKEKCLQCLNENVYYDEIAIAFTRIQQECRDFIALLKHYHLPLESSFSTGSVFTFEQIINLATVIFRTSISTTKLKPKVLENLEEKSNSLLKNANQANYDQMALSTLVQATIAGALVSLKYLPEKLNPVIRPLMDSIKREENKLYQRASASHLVDLMELCISKVNSPSNKIVKNLTVFLCCDIMNRNKPSQSESSSINQSEINWKQANNNEKVIITLLNMQKSAERASLKRANSSTRKVGVPLDSVLDGFSSSDDEIQKYNELQKRGATFALTQAVKHFGDNLAQKLPKLYEIIFEPLQKYVHPDHPVNTAAKFSCDESTIQELICGLQVMEVVGPYLHSKLHEELKQVLPRICCCLEHPVATLRHVAARCLGMFSKVMTAATMDIIIDSVLPKIGATDNDTQRQGAVEAAACIIDELELSIVPYIVFLIVPMLGRMSDQNEHVRLMATHCFASLIKLLPLEGGIQNLPPLRQDLLDRKTQEYRFLEQLMNPKKLEPYSVPVPVNAQLRSYQQEGVNWLAFLNKYKLHGILCDDMGLGKTLQSLCILAGDHYYREEQYREKKRVDCKPLPSLVVCPPTLTGHWVYEVEKFISPKYLNPLHYTGPPTERMRLRLKIKKHNLVIASYDIVRNDIDFFGSIHWNYCILDEGHVIKNGKTKLSRAIKQLTASHRLILSGTPIQNNVLELWSLFDFLMPGFLGTEKQFTARYSKPILLSRDAKSSSKEQEAGVLAMEALHRQVLPFLLRRMKEDVLKDLPPKIIQDYYCELSALQIQLYEDFSKSRAKKSVDDIITEEEPANVHGTSHIFQALQYLRKVCNHPKLVLSANHPEYEKIAVQLKQENSNLNDIQHAAKLCALRQLLLDCGIGVTSSCGPSQGEPEPVVSQHRALVFCQLKGMLDILENDLLRTLMPTVSYLRLDGSVPPGSRHAVVHRFNNDPSIDILLLTTQVGGLGLNLTGADTVIFVEHDWNPMKDLQAMDRAHRIGQKKVVSVYRLITRGTLEEKIMGLQKFKLSVANSVINQENTNLQNMGTDQLLDLFTLDHKEKKLDAHGSAVGGSRQEKGKGMKSVLDNLPELWDTNQYESEYDLNSFLQSLAK